MRSTLHKGVQSVLHKGLNRCILVYGYLYPLLSAISANYGVIGPNDALRAPCSTHYGYLTVATSALSRQLYYYYHY